MYLSFWRTKGDYQNLADHHNDPIAERRICQYTWHDFAVFTSEATMLKKLSPILSDIAYTLPMPSVSPIMRKVLRLMRKNERNLYYHTCDLTDKKSISRIHPNRWVSIYTNQAWASDAWETTDYGISLSNDESIFGMIQKLATTTPYQDLIGSLTNTTTNALYTNYTADITDSYLVFDAHTIKNCYYLTKARRCNDCVDCIWIDDCERCVSCVDCKNCHSSVYLRTCWSCVACWWLLDCVNCNNCIWCVWLQHKQYCIYNKQYTKEEYMEFKKKFIAFGGAVDNAQRIELIQWHAITQTIVWSENVSWESIRNCKHILWWESLLHCEDMLWCDAMSEAQDCMDVSSYGHNSSRIYQCAQVWRYSQSLVGCVNIWRSERLLYCIDVKKSKHCFGCVNMKWKEYCIFNIQYTKEEYFQIVPRLIKSMQDDGVRWSFLPQWCNVIVYNDSKSFENYPVQRVIDASWNIIYKNNNWYWVITLQENTELAQWTLSYWGLQTIPVVRRCSQQNIVSEDTSAINANALPTRSKEITYDQVDRPIRCSKTWKLFRIMKPELDIYQSLECALPTVHQDIRYEVLMNT